jgi:hypothetical protein
VEGQDGNGGLVREDERGGRCWRRVHGSSFAGARPIRLSGSVDLVDLDLAYKAVALASDCAHQSLFLAAIADGLAYRIDVAGDRRFRDDPAVPHGLEQVVLADDAIAVVDELQQ